MPLTLAVMPAVMLATPVVMASNQIKLSCHWFDQRNKPHRI